MGSCKRDQAVPAPTRCSNRFAAVAGRLLDKSGNRAAACDRHADTCIALAASIERMTADAEVPTLEERFVADLPRHRHALEHLTRTHDAERALRLVCLLEAPLYTLGWWAEKVELFDQALAIAGSTSAMRARAHAFRARPGPMHMIDAAHAERGGADGLRSRARDPSSLREVRAVAPPVVVGSTRRSGRDPARRRERLRPRGAPIRGVRGTQVPWRRARARWSGGCRCRDATGCAGCRAP